MHALQTVNEASNTIKAQDSLQHHSDADKISYSILLIVKCFITTQVPTPFSNWKNFCYTYFVKSTLVFKPVKLKNQIVGRSKKQM